MLTEQKRNVDIYMPLILVEHSSGRSENFTLDTSLKLKDIRAILSNNNFMSREDSFIYKKEVVVRPEEAHRTLFDVLDEDHHLNIGMERTEINLKKIIRN